MHVFCCLLECGEYYNSSTGNVTSPGYPNNYPNNAECYYEISAPAGERVVLDLQFQDLESRYDKLYIREIVSGSSRPVIYLTGRNYKPRRIISTENILMLVFKSDRNTTRRGFKATYHTIKSGMRF